MAMMHFCKTPPTQARERQRIKNANTPRFVTDNNETMICRAKKWFSNYSIDWLVARLRIFCSAFACSSTKQGLVWFGIFCFSSFSQWPLLAPFVHWKWRFFFFRASNDAHGIFEIKYQPKHTLRLKHIKCTRWMNGKLFHAFARHKRFSVNYLTIHILRANFPLHQRSSEWRAWILSLSKMFGIFADQVRLFRKQTNLKCWCKSKIKWNENEIHAKMCDAFSWCQQCQQMFRWIKQADIH